MNKKLLYLQALVCLATAASSLVAQCPYNDPNCAVLISGVPHSKETMMATAGSVFYISLEALPSAGYSWQVTAVDGEPVTIERSGTGTVVSQTIGGVHIIGDSYIIPGQAQQIGGNRLQQWEFLIDQAGTYTITFSYRRPWEKKSDPAKVHTVTVNVVDGR